MSEGGLSTNYEANLTVQGKKSDSPIKEVFYYFYSLFSKSVLLDEQFIKYYAEYAYKRDSNTKKLNKDLSSLKEKVDKALDVSILQTVIECKLSKTAAKDKYIYINEINLKYFPPIDQPPDEKIHSIHSKNFTLIDSLGNRYTVHLESSYRVVGVRKTLFKLYIFKRNDIIKIRIAKQNEEYYIDTSGFPLRSVSPKGY